MLLVSQIDVGTALDSGSGGAPQYPDFSRWYAVQCQPHRERAAAEHLKTQGYRVFLPCRRKTRRHARRQEIVVRPFFPGYLFVHLDLSRERWRAINGTFGVARIVMQGDRPAPAPIGVIEALKSSCDENDILDWQPFLVPGQDVRVADGPFADLVGRLDRLEESGRVRVLLNILGGTVPASLPRSHVVPAESLV